MRTLRDRTRMSKDLKEAKRLKEEARIRKEQAEAKRLKQEAEMLRLELERQAQQRLVEEKRMVAEAIKMLRKRLKAAWKKTPWTFAGESTMRKLGRRTSWSQAARNGRTFSTLATIGTTCGCGRQCQSMTVTTLFQLVAHSTTS